MEEREPAVITNFLKQGTTFLERLDDTELLSFYRRLKNAYYNTAHPLLSDDEFDIVDAYVHQKFPDYEKYHVGSHVSHEKVKLPVFLGSLQKIKSDDRQLQRWREQHQGQLIVSSKLDGVSALLVTRQQTLYTRGNGHVGQNISHLVPYLSVPTNVDYLIRGELIMEKQKDISVRNVVTGVIQQKSLQDTGALKRLRFVPYEIIKPTLLPSEQHRMLHNIFPESVDNVVLQNIDFPTLSHVLTTLREKSIYPMDGIVIQHDAIHERTSESPKHMFAFKQLCTEQFVEITVKNISWKISKDGYLKPTIEFEPVQIGSITIRRATAFHAKFVVEHQIGVGSRILISHEIVPQIHKVLSPATQCQLPTCPFVWSDSGVDILVRDKKNSEQQCAQCVYFTSILKIDGLGRKLTERLFHAGYDSIEKFLRLTIDELCELEGVQKTLATKIVNSIHVRIRDISLASLLNATGIMGRGYAVKKLQLLFSVYPTWYETIPMTVQKGISPTMLHDFQHAIPLFLEFLTTMNLKYKLHSTSNLTSERLKGEYIVFSGVRDKDLETWIQANSGILENQLTKHTTVLIVSEIPSNSQKYKLAVERQIPCLLKSDFCEKYRK